MDPNFVPCVELYDGQTIPAIGFGTYQPVLSGTMDEIVNVAINCGYRLIDGAMLYKNEKETGEGLRRRFLFGFPREDIKIQSKLWNTFHKPSMVKKVLEMSLADLRLKYVDVYLIHWPMAMKECAGLQPIGPDNKLMYSNVPFTDTWKEFEKLHEEGLIKLPGVANFNIKQINKLTEKCRIRPYINQLEVHPYNPCLKIVPHCQKHGIRVEAFSPLGASGNRSWARNEPELRKDPDVHAIAKKHGKTNVAILLRYLIQRGIVPIPKASTPDHIAANIQVFDFNLDEDDINKLNNLKQRIRYNHFDWAGDHPDYPFHDEF